MRDRQLGFNFRIYVRSFRSEFDDTMTALRLSESSRCFPSELDIGIVWIVVSEHDGVPCVVSLEDLYFDG